MNVQFGIKCDRCNSSARVIVGGGSSCSCGGSFITDSTAQDVVENFNCKNCGTTIGMLIGNGNCPKCGIQI